MSQLWLLIGWDRGGKCGGGATAEVNAAMRKSGRSAPMMGCTWVSIYVHGLHGGEVGRVSCGGDSVC